MGIILLLLAVPVTVFYLKIKAAKWAFREMEKRGEKVTVESLINYRYATKWLNKQKKNNDY